MFSGLRYIFGYTAADSSVASTNESSNESDIPSGVANGEQMTLSGSAILEQTLNAATTKLSEQLLPAQASIEQLQSSSKHLLPSITEQHEEKELKKKNDESLAEPVDSPIDDDDCLEVDSWELLDLVEKKEAEPLDFDECGLNQTVQADGSSHEAGKSSTSGILKTNANSSKNTLWTSGNAEPKLVRQKPKVSFETPDLVSNRQNIGGSIIKTAKAGPVEKMKKKNNKRKGAKATQVAKSLLSSVDLSNEQSPKENKWGKDGEISIGNVSVRSAKDNSMEEFDSIEFKKDTELVVPIKVAKVASTLNYAAAVSQKQAKKEQKKEVHGNSHSAAIELQGSLKSDVEALDVIESRNKASSTSSCASTEEITAEYLAKESCSLGKAFADQEEVYKASIDSPNSSDFSDCDFNYGGVDDYYLKPKRKFPKRIAKSDAWSKLALYGAGQSKQMEQEAGQESTKTQRCNERSVAKQAKVLSQPRKKRIGLKISTSHEFLKKAQKSSATGIAVKQVEGQIPVSSNDSSDIAEMDESWYVTPPPCFTGKVAKLSNVNEQPKVRDSARENELIERPAVPVSIKSASLTAMRKSHSPMKVENAVDGSVSLEDADAAWDMEEGESFDFESDETDWIPATRRVKVGEVKSKKFKLVDQKSQQVSEKPVSPKIQAKKSTSALTNESSSQMTRSRISAWTNKFDVDDWKFDDREDADSDFDSMFEPVKKRKKRTVTKSKKSSKSIQMKQLDDAERCSSGMSDEIGLPSDISVEEIVASDYPGLVLNDNGKAELISVRSSSSFDTPLDGHSLGKVNEMLSEPATSRKPPTQVRPISPERKPGWQLKRQRSKRRPLTHSSSPSLSSAAKQRSHKTDQLKRESTVSPSSSDTRSSSARSTPTLIDRIGSSIVANINNLTSGLVASGSIHSPPVCSGASMPDNANQASSSQQVVCKQTLADATNRMMGHKSMSKGSLKRQNICVKQASSQRRPDRRLKMFATPNGCSINRKVQSNFH